MSRAPFDRHGGFAARALHLIRKPAALGVIFWALVVGLAYAADCVMQGQIEGTAPYGGFGYSIGKLRDINVDGVSEIIVGAPGLPGSPFPQPGAVFVYSGANGMLLHELHGVVPDDRFGIAVAGLGDLSGDGIGEFMVGCRHCDATSDVPADFATGRAYIYSGADGSLFREVSPGPSQIPGAMYGHSLAVGADLDGDGMPDYAIGAPGDVDAVGMRTGAVYVYSGRTGDLLYSKTGEADGDQFGSALGFDHIYPIDAATDVRYLAVGAPGADVLMPPLPMLNDAGAVYVWSGPTGDFYDRYFVPTATAQFEGFGSSLAPVGDADTDGRVDFIVGAPNAEVAAGFRAGSVYVLSGAPPGHILSRRDGIFPEERFGRSVGPIGDVTGDSVSDIWVGAPDVIGQPGTGPGRVEIYMGGQPNGGLLCQPTGLMPGEGFGHAMADLGDLNGDGLHEFMVGVPAASFGPIGPTGAVRFYSVIPGPPVGAPVVRDVSDSSSEMTVTWDRLSPDCAGFDFAIYRGIIDRTGDGMTDPLPLTCSTGGLPTYTFPIQDMPGAQYFIVTALTDEQGPYGRVNPGPPNRQPSRQPCRVFLSNAQCGVPVP